MLHLCHAYFMNLISLRQSAKSQASDKELAAKFRVELSELSTPDARKAIEDGRAEGLLELREKQWDRAMKGDTAALAQLTKHLLGQHDKNININISMDDMLKAAEALRCQAQPLNHLHIATRSDDVLPGPPGENSTGGVGGLLPTSTDLNFSEINDFEN